MDEAGSRARIGTMTRPPQVKELEAAIEDIKTKKERAIKNQDFEGAAGMRDKEKQAKEKLEAVLKEWRTSREEKRVKVDEEDILHVVSKWTGIPLQRMEQGEMQRLFQVETEMDRVVIGQREAVSSLCKALRRSRADLKDPRRADWHVRLARPDRGRQDPSGQDPGRAIVRRFQGPHPTRHERPHWCCFATECPPCHPR